MGSSHSVDTRPIMAELAAQRAQTQRLMDENQRIHEEHRESQRKMMEEMQAEYSKMAKESQELQKKLSAEEVKREVERLAAKIEEDAKKRVAEEEFLRKQAEKNLKEGIPPVEYPTAQDIQAVKEKLQYQQGRLHIAITGVSGSGKSSLINAFRGYSNKQKGSAKTGTSETTGEIGRYCDPSLPWVFWYDVPGAGTLKVPDWQYFNDQGLYILDVIIIAIGDRFTKIDVGLLFNCKRLGIPVFVVRSKADQHIRNMIDDGCGDDDDDDDDEDQEKTHKRACDKFVKDTRQTFKSVFTDAGLPPQNVYIVSKEALRSIVKAKPSKNIIDEAKLIEDILHAANKARQHT